MKADSTVVKDDLFEHDIEKTLFDSVSLLLKSSNGRGLVDLVAISKQFTVYFDEVLVMVDDVQVRDNRLRFLAFCDRLFLQFADFEKIVIAQ